MTTVVDLSELYPPTIKYMVYHHSKCSFVWIEKGLLVDEPRMCPLCLAEKIVATKGYKKESDAAEYRRQLISLETEQRKQFSTIRVANALIFTSPETRMGEMANASKMTPSGYFALRWLLNAEKLPFPHLESNGFSGMRNEIVQPTLRFCPNPDEPFIGMNYEK